MSTSRGPDAKLRESLNRLLDELPRPYLHIAGREFPTYLACGIVGFHIALIVLFGAGLVGGRSLLTLAVLALASGLSCLLYTYLRMRLTGHEALVQMEHVWFALACDVLVLRRLGEPVLMYLDVVVVALCVFLAVGRVGCILVGCCHGRPSLFGLTYGEEFVREGFPRHLVGVRLFPLPVVEAAGLLFIGAMGFLILLLAGPGQVFVWFLLAHAVLRFGLEGRRGDHRPQLLGLSPARWMAVVQAVVALLLAVDGPVAHVAAADAALLGALAVVLVIRWRRDPRRRLLAPSHLREMRELARDGLAGGTAALVLRTTSQGVGLATSGRGLASAHLVHVSVSLVDARSNLPLLCELVARAFPDMSREGARLTGGRVLHLLVPPPLADRCPGRGGSGLADGLYGDVMRQLQRDGGIPPRTLVTVVARVPAASPAFPPEVRRAARQVSGRRKERRASQAPR